MAEYSITHTYDAAPERVFDAWLNPSLARRFLFATPTGEMIRAETAPRVGVKFSFVDRRQDMGDVLHTGTYFESARPRRLAFTFAVPQFDPNFSRVVVEITRASGGGSESPNSLIRASADVKTMVKSNPATRDSRKS